MFEATLILAVPDPVPLFAEKMARFVGVQAITF
jgi:hypothetical protein